jgi:fatty acyl-CoA reductase
MWLICFFKLFEGLSQHCPDFASKLVAINGDLMLPNLGLSDEDERLLVKNCNIIFHSAATLRFDEPLKLAVEMNIIGVKKMLDLSKKIKNLEVFVHVSTAYANCDRQHVSETVYNPPVQPDRIIEAVDWMEEDLVKLITPKVIKLRPNTYTFTKAIAENLIIEAEKYVPCVIVRPSIVGASWREPFSGWIDNYNGPTAIFVGVGKGVIRTMKGNRHAIADIIPVDVVINLLIASAWYKGTKKTKDTLVFNCTSGQINPLRWEIIEKCFVPICHENPYDDVFLVPHATMVSSTLMKNTRFFLFQLVPAYLADFYMKLIKKKPM